jgi:parallel beta-helix repeat protein
VVGNTFSNIEPPTSIAIGQPNHPRGYGIYTFSVFTSANSQHGLSTMPSNLSKNGGNTFTNVTNGIYSFNNGQVNIARNTFDYQNNPRGRGTAISVSEGTHPLTNKNITTNNINNYNKGILVVTTENARVSGNIVNNLKLMPASFSSLRAMGIRIEGGSNNVVQGNTVQNNNASSVDWRWEGISVSNSGSLVVSCNTIRKMGKSIRFQGVNDPVQIKKNFMYNGTAGIVLSDNGFINEQGTNGTPWDNEWYSFSSRHLYTMNNTFADQINYHIFSGTSPKHPANFNNANAQNSTSFNILPETGSLFMLCAIPLMSASPAYGNWMNDVANNTNANLQAPLHRNWMGRNGLYRTLKEDSLLAQNASLQSFVYQLETESQGVLKKVQDTLLMNDYLAAKIMNDDLTPSTKPDSVFKDINSVCINAVMTNNNDWATAISQSGLDSLKTIAELCPFEYGEMVYLSRIMLKMLGDTTEYFNECEFDEIDAPGKSMMSTNNEMFVNVFPNPATTEITIETDIALPATVTFYSALGQIILIQDIYDESSIVDVRTISEQLVLYELKGLNGEIARGLLQISR